MNYFFLLLILIGFTGTVFAEQIPVNIQTLNDTDFIISGTIQTPKDGDQIAITVKNNFDVIIFVSQIVPDSSGYFSLDVTRQGDLWKNTESFTVNAVRTSVYDKGVILAMLKPGKNQIISPKAQVVMGFEPSNVMCNRDLQLVIKSSDGSPACVKHDTTSKLIERGWARIISIQHPTSILSPTVIIPRGVSEPVSDSFLDPTVVVVKLKVNNTVSWINKDIVALTLKADDARWSIDLIKPNEIKQVRFNHTGLYEYHTEPFRKSGSIVVLDDDVKSLDLREKLKMAMAILSLEMDPGSSLVGLGIDDSNILKIEIIKDELKRIPNAKEYYEKKYMEIIPFDIPLRIEFVSPIYPD